jgi:hypothetical protein
MGGAVTHTDGLGPGQGRGNVLLGLLCPAGKASVDARAAEPLISPVIAAAAAATNTVEVFMICSLQIDMTRSQAKPAARHLLTRL